MNESIHSKILRHASFYPVAFAVLCILFSVWGCGYRVVGSKSLPFSSVTIAPVQNKTYEPKLEEQLHNALSGEFIAQGINVRAREGDVRLDVTIETFEIGALAYIDEKVQEQSITMKADITITDGERVISLGPVESPIQITFRSTGTVSESAARKERSTEKACREIAREVISKIILRYAE